MTFYEELKDVLTDKDVFILHGYILNIGERGIPQGKEIDFVILNKKFRQIIIFEIKYSIYRGNHSPCQRAVQQLYKTRHVLEKLIGDLELQNWRIVLAIGFNEQSYNEAQKIKSCEKCKPFLVEKGKLKSFFDHLQETAETDMDNEGYKKLIRRILINSFASSDYNDHTISEKIKQQGSTDNILFWTPSQFDLVQLDYEGNPRFKNVLFTSSFSTGKTEVMRAMMMKLKDRKKCHYIVCHRSFTTPLLYMQFFIKMKSYKNIQITSLENIGESLKEDLQCLLYKIAMYPDHYTFVDEFIVNNFKNEGKTPFNLSPKDEERKNVDILNEIQTITKV